MAKQSSPTPQKPAPELGDGSMQMLLDEIDQEVKAKEMADLLKKYGKPIIGVIIAIILGSAIYNVVQNIQNASQAEDSEKLASLMATDTSRLNEEELKQTLKAYVDLGENGSGEGQRIVGRLAEVTVLQKMGQGDVAITRLNDMANDQSLNPIYRDYARLLNVRARMDAEKDAEGALKLQAELQPLLQPNNAWYLSGLEISAMLYAKAGRKDDAVMQLQGIVNTTDAPLSSKERANQLMRLYSVK